MKPLRFAVIGCGFWSKFQIAAWRELEDAPQLVAVYNRTASKARAIAQQFGVEQVFEDPEQMLRRVRPDFVDIITDVDTHARYTELAARLKVPAICQKPMAPSLAIAQGMLDTARSAGVPLMIHENWRWQHPLRQFKAMLEAGDLGRCFRARIQYSTSFPVFDNQPFLREVEQFILADIGSHILDAARFLFGNARTLYCRTSQAAKGIRGEDVATVMLGAEGGATVTCEMSYASRLEHERFPQTFVLAECERGSLELGCDYWVRKTDAGGTLARRCPPPRYAWADPAYDVVHASIVDCNRDLLKALRTHQPAETDAADNIQTVRLVAASYESARTGRAIDLATF
jgi:predicted dehydrogenase